MGTTPESGTGDDAAAPTGAVFIARAPVFDATERVTGYALMLRPSPLAPPRAPQAPGEGIALLLHVLNRFGLEHALGDKLGFVRVDTADLNSDLIELIPKQRLVLEYAARPQPDDPILAHLAALRARGFRLARLGRGNEPAPQRLAGSVDLVIYDLAENTLQDIARFDRLIRPQNVQRMVRNVNTRADFEACRGLGLDLYQGAMLAPIQTLAMNRLDPSRARVIEIFNLVINRGDVDEIERAFKHDVALCYSLLCYINSAGVGLPYKVSSIRDAIMLLGYDFLWRWLSLLIFAGVDLTAAQRLLLNTAIIRGRLAELLSQSRLPSREGNLLFLVGMFSLLDILLGIPLQEVTQRLHLPEQVREALLMRTGPYAAYLELALAFERDDPEQAARLCQELGLDLDEASRAHLAAIEWTGLVAQ